MKLTREDVEWLRENARSDDYEQPDEFEQRLRDIASAIEETLPEEGDGLKCESGYAEGVGNFDLFLKNGHFVARFALRGDEAPFAGHRTPLAIEIEEYNYLKSSALSGDEVRKKATARVYYVESTPLSRTRVHVLTLSARTHDHLLVDLLHLIPKLHEHPLRLFDPEDRARIEGRKVFYRDLPAVIERFKPDMGVFLRPDGIEAFPPHAYNSDREGWEEAYGRGLWANIFDDHIWWYRD